MLWLLAAVHLHAPCLIRLREGVEPPAELGPALPAPRDPAEAERFGLSRWYSVSAAQADRYAALTERIERDSWTRLTRLEGPDGATPPPLLPGPFPTADPLWPFLWNLPDVCWWPAHHLPLPITPVIIAVVDTGVRPNADVNLLAGFNVVPGMTGTDDIYNHGTHVAGTAAAIGNNHYGVVGVAAGFPVLPVKVLYDSGFTTQSWMAAGAIVAADYGARVINTSLQYPQPLLTYTAQVGAYVEFKGVVWISAAGNWGQANVSIPASLPTVVAVGACTWEHELASFSNHGPELDLVAPGTFVTSITNTPGVFAAWPGTSMASPHVAGAAALLIARNGALTPAQVRGALTAGCVDLGPAGRDDTFGHGLLNAYAASFAGWPCYADINRDGVLSAADFAAFQTAYAVAADAANCDTSLTPAGAPTFSVADFGCFQSRFNAGCP